MNGRRWIAALVALTLVVVAPLAGDAQLPPRSEPVPLDNLGTLCAFLACSPTITDVFFGSRDDTVTPGQDIIVRGSGFGERQGTVWMSLPGRGPAGLKVNLWKHWAIMATIPEIEGVPDTTGFLTVRTTGPFESNALSVPFKATRSVALVTSPAMTVNTCVDADSRNTCNSSFSCTAIRGQHTGWIFGRSGVDVYSLTMRNGWLTSNFVHDTTESLTVRFAGWSSGVPSVVVTASWSYGFLDGVTYAAWIAAIGPKGVPTGVGTPGAFEGSRCDK